MIEYSDAYDEALRQLGSEASEEEIEQLASELMIDQGSGPDDWQDPDDWISAQDQYERKLQRRGEGW